MSKIKLLLEVGIPTEPRKPVCEPMSIEDEIRDSIQLINSYQDSSIEWRALRGLYDRLCKMPSNPRIQNLKQMIKPVLAKYGYFPGE
jgi:hypothetical protein